MSDVEMINNENEKVVDFNNSQEIAELSATDIDPVELCHLQILDLKKQLAVSRQEWEDLYGLVMESMKEDDFATLISNEVDYSRWFRLLSRAVMKYMVIMTVRDTPGHNMPDHIYKTILESGFTKFKRDFVYTYVGVICKGKVWCDYGKHHDEASSYSYESMDGSFSLKAYSESWKNGNRGDIFINDKQISVNSRGVNIVIYDVRKKRVIDSIGFDGHEEGKITFRRRR